jgi:hypothetical protein
MNVISLSEAMSLSLIEYKQRAEVSPIFDALKLEEDFT